jgi:hypothetical protein
MVIGFREEEDSSHLDDLQDGIRVEVSHSGSDWDAEFEEIHAGWIAPCAFILDWWE